VFADGFFDLFYWQLGKDAFQCYIQFDSAPLSVVLGVTIQIYHI